MAISSTNNRNDYTGNNATATYPYTYRIFAETDIKVTMRTTAGVETVLPINSGAICYTVDGVGDGGGGNVYLKETVDDGMGGTTLVAYNLPTSYKLTLRRVRPLTQTSDIRNQGDFFPETYEDAYDHGIMVAQQLQDLIDRSVKLQETIPASGFDPTLPSDIASTPGSAIVVNAAGTGLSMGATVADVTRLFGVDTYANLKAAAVAAPTLTRSAWATDVRALMFYTTDITVGDAGWIILGGG